MRDVAVQRDAGLRCKRAELSPDRLRRLQAALARKFPLETALHSAAMRRDASLRKRESEIPAIVQTELAKRLACSGGFGTRERFRSSRHLLHLLLDPPANAAGIAAAVAVLMGGAFYFSAASSRAPAIAGPGQLNLRRGSASISASRDAASLTQPGNRVFESSADHLTLRVGKIELASLEPSLLSINRTILADPRHADRGLPLDLPIRDLLIDTAGPAMP